MKKLSLIIVMALCSIVAMAQNGRIQLRSESRAEITKSEFKTLRAVFSYGSIESVEVTTEQGTFSEIALPGTYASGEIGTPELPASHQLLAVPFGAIPTVSVVGFTTTDYNLSDFGINTIIPHQPSVRKDQRPEDIEFVYNQAAYQTRSLATAPEATIEVQGTMRGIRIGSLLVNPLSYNAATNTLRVFNDIEVEINFEGADYAETERMLVNTYSPYFDIVYKQMFNYRQIMDVYTDHPDLMAYPVHMLVIAPENYISTLQPWINWKIQKGFDVEVYTTAQAGSNYSAIRSFVQNKYNTGVSAGETPTFLILVGDVAQVPNTTGNQSGKVTDLYYGSVDNDYFPDMFYSRMSAENTNQLTAIINKILMYEQYTMPDPSYLNNVTLIAGWDYNWNPKVAQPTVNYATTYYYNTAHGFSQVNAHLNQSQYSGCYNALNTGVGFVNYTAHGDNQEWYQPNFNNNNVNQLTNTNKYFLAMGNCCLAANFGYSQPCFGETMIRAENKAAFSYIGSCPNTYWYEDYYFGVGATHTLNGPTPSNTESTTGIYDAVWMDDTYNTVSSMVFVGNLAVCYVHTGGYQTHSNPTYYWQAYHVLGDGSIMPFRVQPSANNVNHAATFPAGATTFTVSAQAGSYVGISQNNVLLGAALVGTSGSVNVPVTPVSTGNVTIVVTKPQRQPYITTIPVGGGTTTYTITTTASPSNGGTVSGGGTYNENQSCTVTATANANYTFSNWTENGSVVSNDASYTFDVTCNRNLVANFAAIPNYTVQTSSSPSVGGTTSGGGSFQQGQNCTVHATANTNYTFSNWTENGQVVSSNANYSFVVNSNRNLVANFSAVEFKVNANASPTSGGTIAGAGNYHYGETCTLIATPNQGYSFVNWTRAGVEVSTDPSFSFTVTGNIAYTAHFENITYTVTASANPSEGGSVNGGGSFNYGQTCTVSATSNPHYVFEAWTENGDVVSTENSYSFNVTENHDLVANFNAEMYEINVTLDPADGGTVTGAGTYTYGETVTLVAEANEDLMYQFLRWTEDGNEVSTNETYTFTAEASRNLVAEFENVDAIGENVLASRIYPNPASDKLNVICSSNISDLKVYNMLGALVYSANDCGNNVVVSLADMPNGVYFIQVITNNTTETQRFVKE